MKLEIKDATPRNAGDMAVWIAEVALFLETLDLAFKEDAHTVRGQLRKSLVAAGQTFRGSGAAEDEVLALIATFRSRNEGSAKTLRHLSELFAAMPANALTGGY